jgi:hypothetical protein
MADYYPLINKAVAGLDKSTGEARRALYERARTALVTQLRGVQPALSESDITRERLALEEAIRKVEAEAARKSRFDAPPERRRVERSAPPEPLKAAAPKPPPSQDDAQEQDHGDGDDAESHLTGTAADLRRPVRMPPPAPTSRASDGMKEFRSAVADAENLGDATAQAGRSAREAYNAVPAPNSEFERLEPRMEPEGLRARDRRPLPQPQRREPSVREPSRPPPLNRQPPPAPREPVSRDLPPRDVPPRESLPRDLPPRPSARDRAPPQPPGRAIPPSRDSMADFDLPPRQERTSERANERPHERGNEYSARDFGPPPDFDDDPRGAREPDFDHEPPRGRTRRRAEAVAAEPEFEEEAKPRRPIGKLLVFAVIGLVLLGVASGVAWRWQDVAGALHLSSPFKNAASTPQPQTPPAAQRPQKDDSRVRPSDSPNPNANQSTQAGADVAQRVVLYEEDPEDQNGKRFIGSAVWRTETVTRGANQPPDLVVRADIDIPDRKMTMKWVLQRNNDKSLPASHTVEVVFKLPPDFVHGGVQNVPGLMMKPSEEMRGVPLSGLVVKVMEGYFLIGLSATDSEMQRNIELLKTRPWFDVPIVYTDGRRAILAVEKGNPGDRAFNEAFAAWKQ